AQPAQHRLVCRLRGPACRPSVDALDEAGAELRVVAQALRQACEVVEALSVEHAARVDGRAALSSAVLARPVEILEGEADGIGQLVTAAAHRVRTVQVEALARSLQARVRILE